MTAPAQEPVPWYGYAIPAGFIAVVIAISALISHFDRPAPQPEMQPTQEVSCGTVMAAYERAFYNTNGRYPTSGEFNSFRRNNPACEEAR